jgi:shikimate dehydrogenase
MTDRYAVFGNPIAHSKSPQIHGRFAELTGQDIEYTRIEAPIGGFADKLRAEIANGLCGANVTVPFKLDAFQACDELSPRALNAGAINTIIVETGGRLHGDNTDGLGLMRDIVINHGIQLRGQRVLLLGSGGAVRGVLGPLLENEPAVVTIANRTPEKASQLADQFADLGRQHGCLLEGGGWDEAQGEYALIINGTSAGLTGDTPPIDPTVLAAGGACYDMLYSDKATPFQQWAREAGAAKAIDGLGMLIEQAAESFYRWRGVRPETASVIAGMRG